MQKTYRLQKKHGWKSRPGYAICVLDRGAVRFDFPKGWIMKQENGNVSFHDKEPPKDDVNLIISVFHLPPIDWSELPLGKMLDDAVPRDREVISRTEVSEERRGDLEIAWLETRYTDPEEGRQIYSRTTMARSAQVQCLITYNYYVELAAKFRPVWTNIMRSLVLERYVQDPTRGPVTH